MFELYGETYQIGLKINLASKDVEYVDWKPNMRKLEHGSQRNYVKVLETKQEKKKNSQKTRFLIPWQWS